MCGVPSDMMRFSYKVMPEFKGFTICTESMCNKEENEGFGDLTEVSLPISSSRIYSFDVLRQHIK